MLDRVWMLAERVRQHRLLTQPQESLKHGECRLACIHPFFHLVPHSHLEPSAATLEHAQHPSESIWGPSQHVTRVLHSIAHMTSKQLSKRFNVVSRVWVSEGLR